MNDIINKRWILSVMFFCITTLAFSQSIVVTSGNVNFIKESKVLQFTFSYNEMLVGKMTESEYINKKVSQYETEEAGRGERWKREWISNCTERFEPKFQELFDKYMLEAGISSGSEGALYVVEINTDFTEPGWNVGVMRQNASIDLSCKVKNIATGEQVASIKIRNASANNFWGTDFESGYRVQETYAKAGRALAKFFIKKAKL